MNESGRLPSQAQALTYGIAGLCFCLCLVLAPDLLPALIGPREGYVWTPFNSPLYRFGDSYYYMAWVAEVIQSGVPPSSPSAAEYAGKPLVETLRWFPLAVAALPSLATSDVRIVYVLGYAFTACLFFGVPFYLSYRLTRSPLGSLLIGVLVLFYAGQGWWNIVGASKVLINLHEYEMLNTFRYINLSVSGPILMAYAALCHVLYAKAQPSRLATGAVLVLSPCMAFSYPSHALIAYACLGGYAILAFLRGNRQGAITLSLIGALTALGLLIGGYVGFVQQTLSANELWNNIFHKESLALVDRPVWDIARMAFINRYTVTLSLALWLAWKNRELRDMVLVFGAIGCGLALTRLFDMPQLTTRFLDRGIDHLWLAVFATACLWAWQKRFKPWVSSRNLARGARLLEAAILIPVLAIPAIGFGSYALVSANNLTRYMPEGRWRALEWIGGNVPKGDTIAALNWDDITFIPIYTHANLAVDNMIIGGRGPADELRRYVALWKMLGFPREQLEARLASMIQAGMLRRNSRPEARKRPPLLEPEVYASSQIADAVLYWPYVQKVNGIDIAAERKTSKTFLNWAMALYDDQDAKAVAKEYRISMVLLSGAELNIPLKAQIPLEQVFKNQTHTMYRVVSDASH